MQSLKTGIGSEDFRKQMLDRMEGKLGDHHSGQLRQETAEAKAERIIGEELRRLGWQEADLRSRPKSDRRKLAIAARVRRETTLSIKVIAGRVGLGTSKSANIRLHAAMKAPETAEVAQARLELGEGANHVMG